MAAVFLSNEMLTTWSDQGKVRLDDTTLTLLAENRTVKLRPAVRFNKTIDDGVDPHKLLGKVKTTEQLAALGAEHYLDSVILGDTGYQVVEGFLGDLSPPAPGQPSTAPPRTATGGASASGLPAAAPPPAAPPPAAPPPSSVAPITAAVEAPVFERRRDASEESLPVLEPSATTSGDAVSTPASGIAAAVAQLNAPARTQTPRAAPIDDRDAEALSRLFLDVVTDKKR